MIEPAPLVKASPSRRADASTSVPSTCCSSNAARTGVVSGSGLVNELFHAQPPSATPSRCEAPSLITLQYGPTMIAVVSMGIHVPASDSFPEMSAVSQSLMSVPGRAACACAAPASATISARRAGTRRNDGRRLGALSGVHTVTDSPVSGRPGFGTRGARQARTNGRKPDAARASIRGASGQVNQRRLRNRLQSTALAKPPPRRWETLDQGRATAGARDCEGDGDGKARVFTQRPQGANFPSGCARRMRLPRNKRRRHLQSKRQARLDEPS